MTIPTGEPPQLPDRGARPVALRGCWRNGGVPGPSALKQTSREAITLLYAPALDPHLQKLTELANLGVLHLQRAGSGQRQEGRGEDAAGSPENSGGILMRWPWRQQARPIEPRPVASIRAMELETAKEILAEVFHARPGEVEEIIKSRPEEGGPEEREVGRWPATFCLGE